jgi:hypothetical protein
MSKNIKITREQFLADRQGRTFADVVEDADQPFDRVLEFFNQPERQRRMEEAELHHDRPPLAGVVRELEVQPDVDAFLRGVHPQRTQRLRQAIGVVIRMIMELRGWKKTGRKGSLGVRAKRELNAPSHNSGGLSFWFVRAERYVLESGMPFHSVNARSKEFHQSRRRQAKSN